MAEQQNRGGQGQQPNQPQGTGQQPQADPRDTSRKGAAPNAQQQAGAEDTSSAPESGTRE